MDSSEADVLMCTDVVHLVHLILPDTNLTPTDEKKYANQLVQSTVHNKRRIGKHDKIGEKIKHAKAYCPVIVAANNTTFSIYNACLKLLNTASTDLDTIREIIIGLCSVVESINFWDGQQTEIVLEASLLNLIIKSCLFGLSKSPKMNRNELFEYFVRIVEYSMRKNPYSMKESIKNSELNKYSQLHFQMLVDAIRIVLQQMDDSIERQKYSQQISKIMTTAGISSGDTISYSSLLNDLLSYDETIGNHFQKEFKTNSSFRNSLLSCIEHSNSSEQLGHSMSILNSILLSQTGESVDSVLGLAHSQDGCFLVILVQSLAAKLNLDTLDSILPCEVVSNYIMQRDLLDTSCKQRLVDQFIAFLTRPRVYSRESQMHDVMKLLRVTKKMIGDLNLTDTLTVYELLNLVATILDRYIALLDYIGDSANEYHESQIEWLIRINAQGVEEITSRLDLIESSSSLELALAASLQVVTLKFKRSENNFQRDCDRYAQVQTVNTLCGVSKICNHFQLKRLCPTIQTLLLTVAEISMACLGRAVENWSIPVETYETLVQTFIQATKAGCLTNLTEVKRICSAFENVLTEQFRAEGTVENWMLPFIQATWQLHTQCCLGNTCNVDVRLVLAAACTKYELMMLAAGQILSHLDGFLNPSSLTAWLRTVAHECNQWCWESVLQACQTEERVDICLRVLTEHVKRCGFGDIPFNSLVKWLVTYAYGYGIFSSHKEFQDILRQGINTSTFQEKKTIMEGLFYLDVLPLPCPTATWIHAVDSILECHADENSVNEILKQWIIKRSERPQHVVTEVEHFNVWMSALSVCSVTHLLAERDQGATWSEVFEVLTTGPMWPLPIEIACRQFWITASICPSFVDHFCISDGLFMLPKEKPFPKVASFFHSLLTFISERICLEGIYDQNQEAQSYWVIRGKEIFKQLRCYKESLEITAEEFEKMEANIMITCVFSALSLNKKDVSYSLIQWFSSEAQFHTNQNYSSELSDKDCLCCRFAWLRLLSKNRRENLSILRNLLIEQVAENVVSSSGKFSSLLLSIDILLHRDSATLANTFGCFTMKISQALLQPQKLNTKNTRLMICVLVSILCQENQGNAQAKFGVIAQELFERTYDEDVSEWIKILKGIWLYRRWTSPVSSVSPSEVESLLVEHSTQHDLQSCFRRFLIKLNEEMRNGSRQLGRGSANEVAHKLAEMTMSPTAIFRTS